MSDQHLIGTEFDDVLAGAEGNDWLEGLGGNDLLEGGAGDDLLSGGLGADTYVFGRGDGNDSVDGSDETDRVQLGAGIWLTDVSVERLGDDLVLGIEGTADTLRVTGYFTPGGALRIDFVDGASWDAAAIGRKLIATNDFVNALPWETASLTLDGGLGDDFVNGASGDDILYGDAGADNLNGGTGVDTYLFGRGDGRDSVTDASIAQDRLQFGSGITLADVRVTTHPFFGTLTLELEDSNGADAITIAGWFSGPSSRLAEVRFADGTVLTADEVEALIDNNDAPIVVNPIADQTGQEDVAFAFSVPADAFSDADLGDTLTYTAGLAGGDPLPSWLAFDAATRTFAGTPPDGSAATLSVRVTATDGSGASASDDFDLAVVHQGTITGTEGDDTLSGTTGRDLIDGLGGADTMSGGAGDDALLGGGGNDILYGGAGNDEMRGGVGADTYLFGRGDGQDRIGRSVSGESMQQDRLQLGSGITLADVQVGQVVLGDLRLDLGGGDQLTLLSYLLGGSGTNNMIGRIDFADGATWDNAAIQRKFVATNDFLFAAAAGATVDGGLGHDLIFGGAGNDILYGDEGNDTLQGGAGADMYLFGRGDGQDTIFAGLAGSEDRLVFGSGIAAADFIVSRDFENSMVLAIAGTTDRITVGDHFNLPEGSRLNEFRFSDGTVLSAAQIEALQSVITGTEAGDILTGTAVQDSIYGLGGDDFLFGVAGDDFLFGGDGNDRLVGGIGSDRMHGGRGSDVYVFARGTGADFAAEEAGDTTDFDIVEVAADILPGDISVKYELSMLGPLDSDGFVLRIAGTNDSLKLTWSPSTGAENEIERVTFLGAPVSWSEAELAALAIQNGSAPFVSSPVADRVVNEDSPFSFVLPSNEFGDIELPIGDSLVYSARLASGAALPSWLAFDAATRTFSGTALNANVGTISVRVTATDQSGRTGSDVFDIRVANTNDTPTLANAIGDQSAQELVSVSFTLPPGTFTDVDLGDTLTYSASFANGDPLPEWLALNGNIFSWRPPEGSAGTYSVRVTATDRAGSSVSDDFELTVVHERIYTGTAGNDIIQGNLGHDVILGLGGSDILTGSNGNDRLFGGDGDDFLLGGDHDDRLDGGAGSDRLTGGSGNDAYVFARGMGTDRLLLDGGLASDVDVIEVAADILSSEILVTYVPETQPGVNDSSFVIGIAGTGDSMQILWAPGVTISGTIEEVRFAGGTVWTLADLAAQAIQNGHAPTLAAPLADQAAQEDAPFSFTVPAGAFTDADVFLGDSLVYGARLAGGAALPSWLSFDAATRTFSGTPLNANVGATSIEVTATDESGRSASDVFDLTVANTNDAPTLANPIADQSARDTVAFSFTVPSDAFADADANDAFVYSSVGLPSWLSFDAATRTFSGTPDAASIGGVDVTVTATDSAGAPVSDVFRINVAPAPDQTITGTSGNNTLAGGSGNDTINGLRGADRMSGGLGNDTLSGGAGKDTLNGGAGNDTLNGGTGTDTFVFSDLPGAANADLVRGFTSSDRIHLDDAVMAGLGANGRFSASDARFWASTSGTAHDASDRVIYNTNTGELWYDANGNVAGGAELIAILENDPTLTASQISVI